MNTTEPFRQVLTSVERNVDLGDWSIDHRALHLDRVKFEIRKRRLHGARQEGVDLITVDNGRIAVTVIPTRGMGILKVESPEMRLGWNSPVREVVHPHFINLQSRGGLGWLEGFNEWLVRCGLESAGAPGKDQFVTNTGAEAEMDLTLHGKIANIPASETEVVIDRVPPYAIRLRGRVDEAMFYGPKLELWTELVLEPGAMRFQVQDTVTNRGGADQEFELIYHINFGPPLLQAGSAFAGAAKRMTPMNAHAAKDAAQHASYSAPIPGFVEQVYCMEPIADAEGRTTVLLRNAAGDRAASLTYAVHQLPCFTLWKSTNSEEEGYVTGLEPGTNFPNNRRVEREAGRLSKLAPGESRRFVIDVGLHATREEVADSINRIERLRSAAPGTGS
jgi:hypothetical protein